MFFVLLRSADLSKKTHVCMHTHLWRGKKLDANAHLVAKGAETRHMLGYIVELLDAHVSELEAKRPGHGFALRNSCRRLHDAYGVMRKNNRDLSEDDQLELLDCFLECGLEAKKACVPMIPKFHALPHLGEVANTCGNPAWYSTYEDESTYRDDVRIAQACTIGQFEAKVLSRCELLECLERQGS